MFFGSGSFVALCETKKKRIARLAWLGDNCHTRDERDIDDKTKQHNVRGWFSGWLIFLRLRKLASTFARHETQVS
jgi:hypothetical protein